MSVAKVIGIVAGGCLLLVVLVVVAGFFGLQWLAKTPEGVEVEVEAPLRVTVGESFEVIARAENTSRSTRVLVDLDIAQQYLAGLAIEASRPPFRDAFHVPLDETLSHSYELAIQPGGEVVIELSMIALHAGDFGGDFDFCIDSEVRCLSYPVRTVVQATPAGD